MLQVCQPSGQPPAVVWVYIYTSIYLYVWSKQGLFNCYLTIIYIYNCIYIIYKHTHVHILLYIMVHVHEKDKVWKQSRNWLFCSGFKVSKYLSGHHRCLSHSVRSRRFFPTVIFLYFHYHRTHTHIYAFLL